MKGYPKSRFDIIDRTQVQTIEAAAVDTPTALYMAAYTSNKGTEDWELISGLDNFTKEKGGISFNKHGQGLLNVAEALRSGAYVLGKRMVSDDATLANTTVLATVVKQEETSYLYIHTKSATECGNFEDACTTGRGSFDPTAKEVAKDIPLFTVSPMGRGESLLFFRLNPEYISSKNKASSDYIKYDFEVLEDNEVLESIVVTMNPEVIADGKAQAMNPKIKSKSHQIKVRLYEDGIYKLIDELAKTAVDEEGKPVPPEKLINYDFINGCYRKSDQNISGIVTIAQGSSPESPWTTNKPEGITTPYDLANPIGIPLVNGSFGKMGNSPIANAAEYKKMLLGTYGKDTESPLFDTIIYDLDAYKIDAIFDANYDPDVKNAIIDLIDFRGDAVFLADIGTKANTLDLITQEAAKIHGSKMTAIYGNYFNILDPFTKKEITVTMPYKLIEKITKHIANGVGRPIAGIANDMVFNGIIENTINILPVEIPGLDQKQELVNANINYISLYDGTPVMETMYVNETEYTQLSYLHNIMAIQEIIKIIRTRCPRTRYTFMSGNDLETYISDVKSVIKEYSTNFKSIDCEYMHDEKYEQNNIFYAVIKVQFKNFINEEYFKIIAIS